MQTILANGKTYPFDIDGERKRRLMNGLDDIDLTNVCVASVRLYLPWHKKWALGKALHSQYPLPQAALQVGFLLKFCLLIVQS
jgi:hypothetical protein